MTLAEPATLHASHCYGDTGILACGRPELHARSCWTADCHRAPAEGWARCESCTSRLLDRWLGIKPAEAPEELPRWKPVPA